MYYNGTAYLDNIKFADGTLWGKEDLTEKASIIQGTQKDDALADIVKATVTRMRKHSMQEQEMI